MKILSEYEWSFIRISGLLFLLIMGFLRNFYLGTDINTYGILITTLLFMLWLLLSKVITNYIESENQSNKSLSLIHILFYYVAIPLILLALIMLTGFFKY